MFGWTKGKEVDLFEHDFGVVFTVKEGDDERRFTITYSAKDIIAGTFGRIQVDPEHRQKQIMKEAAVEGIELDGKWYLPHSIVNMERGKIEKTKIGTGYV